MLRPPNVIGAIIIARNGDRFSYYQEPLTYRAKSTEATALGEVESHNLGALLRNTYFNNQSPSYIKGINGDLVDNGQVKVHVKAGVEGNVVFDSAIALLQGLFPPTPKNRIILANGTTVVAPLGGYQYVPVETVEPSNERSLESWTNCPNFQKHIKDFYDSSGFKVKAQEAIPFFNAVKDYVFDRPTSLENAWNIFDFVNTQLIHNKTYAHRLPPTLIHQARHWANYHEAGVFSSKDIDGIGNIAGRTLLSIIVSALERITYDEDRLQFMLIETTYQSFISLIHQTRILEQRPDLFGIADYTSSMAIELHKAPLPDNREFLRFKFRNGTSTGFEDVHVFGHQADIPLTEFIYRVENAVIHSNKEWRRVCGLSGSSYFGLQAPPQESKVFIVGFGAVFTLFVAVFIIMRILMNSHADRRGLRLGGAENDILYTPRAATQEKIRGT